MEILKKIGIAFGEILLAILNALGSVIKHHPKFFGIIFITSAIFFGCMSSVIFMNFVAQIIALLIMGYIFYIIFIKKEPPKKKSK